MARKPYVPSVEQMLNDKMKVLTELCVVTEHNKEAVYTYLAGSVAAEPTKNPRTTLDRAARSLILNKVKI